MSPKKKEKSKPMSLRPGLLVSLRTTVRGGVEYQRIDLETKKVANEETTRWETKRVITNKKEFERAKKARSKARSLITSACVRSDFGLICTNDKEAELDEKFTEALKLVEAHNKKADATRVSVYLLKGHIATTNEEAAQAIGSEVRDLIEEMRAGLVAADTKRIRDAAAKAKKLGQMLDEQTSEKVSKAIDEARSAAKAIVKRVETDGENAALVIQELSRKALDEARFAFLDLDGGSEEPETKKRAKPERQVDLFDSEEPSSGSKPQPRDAEV